MNFFLKIGQNNKLYFMMMDDMKISSHNMTKLIKTKEKKEPKFRTHSNLLCPKYIKKVINSKKIALRKIPINN